MLKRRLDFSCPGYNSGFRWRSDCMNSKILPSLKFNGSVTPVLAHLGIPEASSKHPNEAQSLTSKPPDLGHLFRTSWLSPAVESHNHLSHLPSALLQTSAIDVPLFSMPASFPISIIYACPESGSPQSLLYGTCPLITYKKNQCQ